VKLIVLHFHLPGSKYFPVNISFLISPLLSFPGFIVMRCFPEVFKFIFP
jgi:hypothetical protein